MSLLKICTSLLIGSSASFADLSNAPQIAEEKIRELVTAPHKGVGFLGKTRSGRACDGMIEASENGVSLSITSGTMLGLALDSFDLRNLDVKNVIETSSSLKIQGIDPRDGKKVEARIELSVQNGQKIPTALFLYEEQDTWLGFGPKKMKLVSSCSQ